MEPIEKCAWCGKMPTVLCDEVPVIAEPGQSDELVMVQCETYDETSDEPMAMCFNAFTDAWTVDGWNKHQRRIRAAIEAREREAFEAARETASGIAAAADGAISFWWNDFDEWKQRDKAAEEA